MTDQTDRESLAAQLDQHMLEESEILQDFRVLADNLGEGPLRVLVDHIVTEEEMHHFLMSTLCDWLRAPYDPGESLVSQGLDRGAILRQTERLKAHETKTIEGCRDLKGRFGDNDREFFETVLEAIAVDSEKHLMLLTALANLAR